MVVAASQLPTAAPTSAAPASDAGSFGNVLSTKWSGQAADNQSSPSGSGRASGTAPQTISGNNPGTGKARAEKRNSEDHVLAASETLPALSFPPAAQGALATSSNRADPIDSNTQAFASGNGAATATLRSTKSALGTDADVGCQLTSVANPSSAAQALESIRSTAPIDKRDTTAADDPANASSQSTSDEPPSSALLFANVVASAQVQPTNDGRSAGPANPPTVTLPNAVPSRKSRPEATQQDFEPQPEGKSKQELQDAAAASKAPGPANVINVEASPTKAQSWLPQEITLSANGATATNINAAPKRASDGSNRTERKQDAIGSKSPQAASNAQSNALPQQSKIGDSPATAHELTQPTPAATIHDDEDQSVKPTTAMLPEAGLAVASALGDKGLRPQTASDTAAPSPAENVQAAPVVIQSARVLERMGQSEMRLGLNSNNFGSIELHTSVNQDRVGASIATSHEELRAAMMAEMPSLERAIAQHQLRLDGLHMDSGLAAQTGNSGAFSGNPSASRSWAQSAAKVSEYSLDTPAQEISPPQTWTAPYSSGLNVHA